MSERRGETRLDLNRFTTVTFDCYGTLIDWETGILAALRPILQRHGAGLPDEQVLEIYGQYEAEAERDTYQPYREVLARVVDRFGEQLGFAPTGEERAALARSVRDWPAFPDTAAALQTLAARYRLAVISNIDDDLFAGSVRRLGADFVEVITAQQAKSYKPSERNFRLALNRLGTPPEQILHVAQSVYHDIVPASRLGLATVWVNRRAGKPGSGATPPANATPDLEVSDLATLARLVRSS